MGHYRSEMGFEEEDERKAKEKKERLTARTTKLEKEIRARGIASVFAEYLEDESLFRIRYR